MGLVKSVRVDLDVSGAVKTKAELDAITKKAEELKALHPELAVKVDTAAAQEKLALLRHEIRAAGDEAGKQGSDRGGFSFLERAISSVTGLIGGGGGAGGGAAAGGTALIPVVAAAVPVVAGLGTIALGAGTGLAGFGAVAAQTFTSLKTAMTAVGTANDKFSSSAKLVDAAMTASAAGAKAYQASLHGLSPAQRETVKLLGDSHATWQNLTKSQQASVVALSQNSKAQSNLLPAQKQALAALLASRAAWDQLTPAQQRTAKALGAVGAAWSKMAAVFQPAVLGIIAQVAKLLTGPTGAIAQAGVIVKEALPGVRQMVAILGQGMLSFLKGMEPLILPSLGAFNMLLQAIVKQLPPLFAAMAKGMPAWIQLARGIAAVLTFGLKLTTWLVELSAWVILRTITQLHHWESATDAVRETIIRLAHDGEAAFNGMTRIIGRSAHDIATGVGIAWDYLRLITLRLVDNMLRAFSHIPLIGGMFHSAERAVNREILAIQGDINRLQGHTVRIPISFVSPAGGRKPIPGATGMLVPGTGNTDSFPALLMPGEAVVPKHLVPAIAPWLKAQGVPGFAAGGYVDIGERTTFTPSLAAINKAMNQNVYDAAVAAARSGLLAPPATGGDSGARSHSAAVAQAFARSVLGYYGFGASQWLPLLYLWNQESGWNPYAVNPSSGAYGIPQALGHGHPYNLGDYIAQVDWGLAYIRGRYGSPAAAWAHERAFNWYDSGGWLPTGASVAVNTTGRPERVGGPATVINVHLHVPQTAHPAAVGAEVVKMIGEYEKRSGKGWRS